MMGLLKKKAKVLINNKKYEGKKFTIADNLIVVDGITVSEYQSEIVYIDVLKGKANFVDCHAKIEMGV